MEHRTLEDGGWLAYDPMFIARDDDLMATFLTTLPLKQEVLKIVGRTVPTPRLTSWHGDPGTAYTYSRRRFEPLPWTEALDNLRNRVSEAAGVRLDAVLVNYYRDGSDSMGAHADNEPELGPSRDNVIIASVSLGAKRRFVLTHNASRTSLEYRLGGGDLLIMGGTTQQFYKHRVPKTKRAVSPRMNLTFRVVQAPR